MLLDAMFVGGRFTTLDPDRPTAERIGVVGGLIVGLDEQLEGCQARAVHHLDGAAVVPGLHDAHQHLSARGQELRSCDLSPATTPDLPTFRARLREHARGLTDDAWVFGVGFDDHHLGVRPTRELLDEVADGRPVWVTHASHHLGVLNTAAIHRLGYGDPRDLPDVDGGWIERRPDGEPTGVIAERAMELVHEVVRPVPFDDLVEAIGAGADAALADGLTSVTEPGIGGGLTGNGPDDLAAFQAARGRGRLGVRVTVMPEISALRELPDDHDADGAAARLGLDLGIRTGFGDDELRLGGVKLFADGALTSCTAALRDDYLDRPGERGLLLAAPAVLRERIAAAHRAGWQVATHAIGDRAVDLVLDAYEDAQTRWPRPDPRHRIEHFGLAHDEQLTRARRLGVVPVPQARFLAELGLAYLDVVDEARATKLYRMRSLLDAGLELPGSSDCPVVSGAPLAGIETLVTRQLGDGRVLAPDERLTVSQALRAFTLGSAYADRQEHRKGSLQVGKLADLTILGDALTEVEPDAIGDVEVVATVVAGEVRAGATRLTSAG